MSLKLNEENLVVQSLEAVPVDEGRNNDKLIMIIMPLWDSFVLFDPFHCFIVRDKVFGLYYVEFPVSLIVTDIRSALALQYVVITSCFVFFSPNGWYPTSFSDYVCQQVYDADSLPSAVHVLCFLSEEETVPYNLSGAA